MNKKLAGCLLVTLTLFSAQAYAAVACTVDILAVLVYQSGAVNVSHSGRGEYTIICNLEAELQGVAVTTCAMWTSMLLNLKSQGEQVRFYYPDGAGYDSCANLPTYGSAPVPTYIGPTN